MTRTEIFVFDLKDRVFIKAIDRPGIVEGLLIDYLGVQYFITYWDNSERKKVYLPASELEERK